MQGTPIQSQPYGLSIARCSSEASEHQQDDMGNLAALQGPYTKQLVQ